MTQADTTNVRDLTPTVQTILAEGANQGFEGMRRIARVIHSRTQLPRWKGMTSDTVVQQPKQFSGWERKDRMDFLAQQPRAVVEQAIEADKKGSGDVAKGKVWADHYLTTDLATSPKAPSWVKSMKLVERYGKHSFFKE